MQSFLAILGGITAFSLLISVYMTVRQKFRKRMILFAWLSSVLQIIILILSLLLCRAKGDILQAPSSPAPTETTAAMESEPLTTATIPVPEDPRLGFSPAPCEDSDPAVFDMTWDIAQGESVLTDYFREDPISFSLDEAYFVLPGISTFRGGNYRDGAS